MVHRIRGRDEDRKSEHGGVHFAFIGGVSAFAGALPFGLQRGECGRRSFGEADQLPRVPIELRDFGWGERPRRPSGAEDTPYGRLAAVADPTGAGFNLSSLEN